MFASWEFLARKSIITSTILHIHRYGSVKLFVELKITLKHLRFSGMLTFWGMKKPSSRACQKSASNCVLHSKNTCTEGYCKMAETINESNEIQLLCQHSRNLVV